MNSGKKEGRRVNLKQTDIREKSYLCITFHFCRWSVWSSMIENLLAATHILVIKHNLGALYFNVSFYRIRMREKQQLFFNREPLWS